MREKFRNDARRSGEKSGAKIAKKTTSGHNFPKRKKAAREGHLSSTMKTKYYFLAKKSFTVEESITASLKV
jgi:hypothetical protein